MNYKPTLSYKPVKLCRLKGLLKHFCSHITWRALTDCFAPALGTTWFLLSGCSQKIRVSNGTSKTQIFIVSEKTAVQPQPLFLGLISISCTEHVPSCMTCVWETKQPWTVGDFEEETNHIGLHAQSREAFIWHEWLQSLWVMALILLFTGRSLHVLTRKRELHFKGYKHTHLRSYVWKAILEGQENYYFCREWMCRLPANWGEWQKYS